MDTFEERQQKGAEFEARVTAFLEGRGYSITKLGGEFTEDAPDLLSKMPDGVAAHKDRPAFLWEAKASQTITRDSYDVYMQWAELTTVRIFMLIKGVMYAAEVQDIILREAQDVIDGYVPMGFEHKAVDTYWIEGRPVGPSSLNTNCKTYASVDVSSMRLVQRA